MCRIFSSLHLYYSHTLKKTSLNFLLKKPGFAKMLKLIESFYKKNNESIDTTPLGKISKFTLIFNKSQHWCHSISGIKAIGRALFVIQFSTFGKWFQLFLQLRIDKQFGFPLHPFIKINHIIGLVCVISCIIGVTVKWSRTPELIMWL